MSRTRNGAIHRAFPTPHPKNRVGPEFHGSRCNLAPHSSGCGRAWRRRSPRPARRGWSNSWSSECPSPPPAASRALPRSSALPRYGRGPSCRPLCRPGAGPRTGAAPRLFPPSPGELGAGGGVQERVLPAGIAARRRQQGWLLQACRDEGGARLSLWTRRNAGHGKGASGSWAGGRPADRTCHRSSPPPLYCCSQNKDEKSALTAAGKTVGRVGRGRS